jgi:hypothetical protein
MPPDAKPLKEFSGEGVVELVRGPQRRYLPCGLHRAIRDQDLRAARVSEEIEARHHDAEERN